MSGPIRFLIVGLGHIGRRHAALVAAHPDAEVTGVADILPQASFHWLSEICPQARFYPTLTTALTDAKAFDVACICTPNGLHAPQAIACLGAGLDTVVEKPLATSIAEAENIQRTAERTGRSVFGVMQNRYSPASAWLKQALQVNRFGQVLQVHLDCFWNRDHRYYSLGTAPASAPKTTLPTAHPWHGDPDLDGGVLYTQFAHFIDLLCWAFGEPVIETARMANLNHQHIHPFADSGSVLFTLPGAAMGSLNFTTAVWDQNFESTLTVIGRLGTVKLGGQYMNEVRYCHAQDYDFPTLPPSAPGNNYGGYTGSAANHHFVIDNVVDVLRGRAKIATPVRQGVAVVRVIEAMYAAAKKSTVTAAG